MLLLIPIRTDSPVRRLPWINYLLILANVSVYLLTDIFAPLVGQPGESELKRRLMLSSSSPDLFCFFTYQFLHGDFWHLLGNMLFLWVFGNSVNSKVGNWAYLLFYLACGVFAGASFTMVSDGNLIGASGAIAGVTTAYLVLFPRSEVTVFYWLWFYIGTIHVQALLLIGLKMILWDNILSPRLGSLQGVDSVAYSAHIAGYLFGFAVCALLLLIRALPRDQYDIVALARRYRQRLEYRAMMADANVRARVTYGRVARPISPVTARPIEDADVDAVDEVVCLRAEIADLLTKGDYTAAADRYEALVTIAPDQCLSRRQMLLVANQLMAIQRYPQAASAYEKFLKAYPSDSDVIQVKLLLGIIYAKYLRQYGVARQYLSECLSRLTDPQQEKQAREWLAATAAALGQGAEPMTS
ncbi:MAG TPA: rhomboid family intramembrane serine protease [Phycisphaerae bacterium]|nr:rhomboid family intramembrane serine protease [Phycisphaerae bacterium]